MQFASTNDALVVVWLQTLLNFIVFLTLFNCYLLLSVTMVSSEREVWGLVCASKSRNAEISSPRVD